MEKALERTEATPRIEKMRRSRRGSLIITKRTEQKLIGIGLLLICAAVLWLCSTGTTPEDQDATAVVLLVPLALWMLFTKQIVIY